jgi:hypothetical protein
VLEKSGPGREEELGSEFRGHELRHVCFLGIICEHAKVSNILHFFFRSIIIVRYILVIPINNEP